MSKVLLISSNTIDDPYPVYPLGMSILAGDLSARGHLVEQFDLLASGNRIESLCAQVRAFQPEVIAISLRNVDVADSLNTSGSWHLSLDRDLVGSLREVTDAPFVAGGSAFSVLPEEILDYLGADYGVVGRGEGVLSNIIDDLAANRNVPKIVHQPDNGVHGNAAISSPLWSGQILPFYRDRSLIGVQSKRGCDGSCIYCTYPLLDGMEYLYREPGAVVDEIEQLTKEYSVPDIFFVDSVFNDQGGHYLLLAEELVRRETRVRWAAYFRPGAITTSELRL